MILEVKRPSQEGLFLAGDNGFEPLPTVPETAVLPLDESPIVALLTCPADDIVSCVKRVDKTCLQHPAILQINKVHS